MKKEQTEVKRIIRFSFGENLEKKRIEKAMEKSRKKKLEANR